MTRPTASISISISASADTATRPLSRNRSRRRRGRLSIVVVAVVAALALSTRAVTSVTAANALVSLDLVGIRSGTAYTVEVEVGSPKTSGGKATTFRLIADTGSSNDAILGAGCCGSAAAVTFSCADSPTCSASSDRVVLSFAGANIAGQFVTDQWRGAAFGTLDKKQFLVIDQQDTFYRPDYDGITGLAYKALAQPKSSPKPSFYDDLVRSTRGAKDAFGLQLCGIVQPMLASGSTNYSLHAGQMLVGGSEGLKGEKLYAGPILYTPIAQESWYVVLVSDVGFDGTSLGLPCSKYNEPQAIIDSGTSNIAFPSDVYNALMDRIKAATKKAVPGFDESYFDYRKSCCGLDYCDTASRQAALLSLPSIYITLALQDGDALTSTTQHYTVEIPPEYYFRPEMNGKNSDVPCRAMGIAEGSSIVLGDVLLDGLFSYHDRVDAKLGLAVADQCPNGAQSTKKVYRANRTDDWCDCFSDKLKSKSTLSRMVPWGKGCFFFPWWMYVVVACALIVVASAATIGYWLWSGRREKRRALGLGAATQTPVPVTITRSHGDHSSSNSSGQLSAHAAAVAPTTTVPSTVAGTRAAGHYTEMASPREPLSSGSSIALLGADEPPPQPRRGQRPPVRGATGSSPSSPRAAAAPGAAAAPPRERDRAPSSGFLL